MNVLQQALDAANTGRFEEARRLAEEILACEPADRRATAILAAAQNGLGRPAEAAALFRRLCESEPKVARHWANLGTALRAAGDFDAAFSAYERALGLGFVAPDFLLNVALLHLDRLEFGRARDLLRRAAEQAPQHPEIRYFEAVCSFQETRHDDAQRALRGWRELRDASPDTLAGIAALLTQLGETSEAEAVLGETLRLDPGHATARLRLAQLLERTNRVEEAQAQVAALQGARLPGDAEADLLSTQARLAERRGDLSGARRHYEALLARSPAPHDQYHVLYPLARVLDLAGEHEASMSTLAKAHASQMLFLTRSAPRFVAPDYPVFNITRFSAAPEDIALWDHSGAPGPGSSPVFVVGFPRSGTTLLEQALDAHPALESMDEQPFLQNAIDDIRGLGVVYPEHLADLDESGCEQVRARYFERVRTRVSLGPGQRIVDKNPLNMLRLPAIARLFPAARVILVIRHPLDVLTSNYMQHYRAPEIAVMCRSLESLADGYRRAFDFWYRQAALLRVQVLELVYEDFVADFERHARRLADFLQLPWDEAMLRPADQALRKGYISTPSYSQVVQPVNRRAVGRWRSHETHLAGARRVVEPYLQRWGYADAVPGSEEQVR